MNQILKNLVKQCCFLKKSNLWITGLFIVAFLCVTIPAKASSIDANVLNQSSQEKPIQGKVIDNTGVGLPGVNITVKGETIGTTTNIDGEYKLVVPQNSTLVFSFIGYTTQEFDASNLSTINVTMIEDALGLDEVVVVGYGSMKKSDISGAIASIDAKQFSTPVNTSADQMMQGRVAGLRVSQTSGQPGAGTSIRIRGNSSINGSNEPLYVIDGIPISNSNVFNGSNVASSSEINPLSTINPSDIERIEVLKDASSTAIYGSRGSNGVILITTKKGKEGKLKVSYDASYGVQKVARTLDLLSGEDYVEHVGYIVENSWPYNKTLPAGYDDPTINNDWQEMVYQDKFFEDGNAASMQNHNLTFSGGSGTINYYASLNYSDQEGVVTGSGFERYGARLNLDITKNKFKAKFGINTAVTNDQLTPHGGGFNLSSGVISTVTWLPSTTPLYDEDGKRFKPGDLDLDNPLDIIDGIDTRSRTFRTMINTEVSYELMDGLVLSGKASTDFLSGRRDSYNSTLTTIGTQKNGSAYIGTSERSNYVLEGLATYNKKSGDHSFNAILGSTFQRFDNRWFDGEGEGYLWDKSGTDDIGGGNLEKNSVSSGRGSSSLLSYLSRVNYTYKDKYIFTGSVRADGSSNFKKGKKWGYFPSVAFAYRISEESFLDVDAISNLKLRLGWGQIGNTSSVNFQPYQTWARSGAAVFNSNVYKGLQIARYHNPDLTWETTEQLNLGLDFGVFNNRISGSIDIYSKVTKDLLFDMPTADHIGFPSRWVNLDNSKILNEGIEIGINTINVKVGDFQWETNANLTYSKSTVKDLGGREIYWGSTDYASVRIQEGEAPFSYSGYAHEGIYAETEGNHYPGDPIWIDQNGDEIINTKDQTNLGNPYPDWTWGLTNTFSYKGLELSVFLEGAEGAEMFNYLMGQTYKPMNPSRNRLREPIVNRWTPENLSSDWPGFFDSSFYGGNNTNSFTIQDASYVRLKNIKLSYNWNLKSSIINSLTTYATANNVALWTDYIGFDPDVVSSGSSNVRQDLNSYPSATSIMVGVSIGF